MGNVTQVDLPTPGKTYEKGQTIVSLKNNLINVFDPEHNNNFQILLTFFRAA